MSQTDPNPPGLLHRLSEAGDVARSASGRAGAPGAEFETVYSECLAPLRRYLTRLLGDRAEAQDIAHDAFFRTYRAMRSQPLERPRAFLFTTARRLASNFRLRRAARMQPAEAALFERQIDASADTVAGVIQRQAHEALERAILDLPRGCREVLVLRWKRGWSQQRIAETLGLAPSTVSTQLARALRLLRADPGLRLAEKTDGPRPTPSR